MKLQHVLSALFATCLVLLGPSPGNAQQNGLRWAAGGQGSINAEAALATSQVLRLAGLPIYSINSAGTVDGLVTLSQGELDFVNADNRSLKRAWNGSGGFQKIRGYSQVMSGFSTFFFIFVPEGSPIKKVSDLSGKSINGHVPGTAINFWVRDFIGALESSGTVKPKTVKQSQIALNEVFDALQDGRIDAQAGYMFADKVPTWIQQGLARGAKLRVLAMPVETLEFMAKADWEVVKEYPSTEIARIDPEVGKSARIVTSGLTTIIIARDGIGNDVVEKLLNTFYGNLDKVQAAHSANAMYKDGPGTGTQYLLGGIPVHPGAEAFYKKNNVWRADLTTSPPR